MASGDQDLHTLAGAYVLDAVSDDERGRFAAHLAACAQCRDEVDGLREAAARLGTAQAVRPRPELREPTIRAAYHTGQVGPVVAENELSDRSGRRAGPGLARAAMRSTGCARQRRGWGRLRLCGHDLSCANRRSALPTTPGRWVLLWLKISSLTGPAGGQDRACRG